MNKEYVRAKIFKEKFGIPESTMKRYANQGLVRCKKMKFGTRLYHIDDGPVLMKMRELKDVKYLNLLEKNIILSYKSGNVSKKRKICYSRIDDKIKSDKLKYEQELFKKYVEDYELVQEYREIDNMSKSKFIEILERCERDEIESIFVTSTNVIANNAFPLVETILEKKKVSLYILKEDGIIIDTNDPTYDCSFLIKLIENQKKKYENEF